jgi:hypothetical protein
MQQNHLSNDSHKLLPNTKESKKKGNESVLVTMFGKTPRTSLAQNQNMGSGFSIPRPSVMSQNLKSSHV